MKWLIDTNKLSLAACSLAILQPHALVLAAPPPAPRQQPESSSVQSGSNNPGPGPAAKTISPKPKPGAPKPTETFAIIEADQQSYDSPLGRYVAKGNVKVHFNGWILLADRVEVAERSRSFYATGKVRLKKGDQYLQASSVRYSNWEGTGEIEDVYGVIDQDTLKRDTALPPTASGSDLQTPLPPSQSISALEANVRAEGEPPQSFACPQLTASTNRRAISILPPGKTTLPTMEAPKSCIGTLGTNATAKPKRLMEALESVVFQARQYKENPSESTPNELGNKTTASEPLTPIEIDQRVKNVSYQQSWSAGISVNLLSLIGYTAPTNEVGTGQPSAPSNGVGSGQPSAPKFQKSAGTISRIRFQTTNLQIQRNSWTARQLAFTNDPFTPARSWTIARNVTAVQSPDGTTKISARSGNIILENKYSLPAVLSQTLGKEKPGFAIGSDNLDRDGVYIGYNLKPIKIGRAGSLTLQPQLLIERVINGETSSFVAPGANLDTGNVTQSITAADAFGLLAKLDMPINRFNLSSDLSLATLNPEHLSSGTRNTTRLTTPIQLPGHSSATASLFGTYRERSYNGSLGLQNVIYAYGADIGGGLNIQTRSAANSAADTAANTNNTSKKNNNIPSPTIPKSFFNPIGLNWQLRSGNYQANLFSTGTLGNLWRSTLSISAGSSFSLWEGKSIANATDPMTGLRYSPSYIIPGLRLDFGASGNLANYGDGSNQNTLTLFGGPALTLGHFDKPFFDYTRIAASIAGTFNNGLSPFSFDRAVDLRTASFSVAQQIYGPLVIEAGATYNIDPNSIYNGDSSYSYLEVKLQRRSYELGIYYSPYDGIGGIRIKLNDFNFDGSGAPFIPTAATSTMPIRRNPIE